MLFSFVKGIHLVSAAAIVTVDQVAVVAKLCCTTSMIHSPLLPLTVQCIFQLLVCDSSNQLMVTLQYCPPWCSTEHKQLQQGHFLQANSPALQLGGDLKVPFPVKVRAACAPQSLHSGAFLPLIIHSHPQTSDTATAQYRGTFLFPSAAYW